MSKADFIFMVIEAGENPECWARVRDAIRRPAPRPRPVTIRVVAETLGPGKMSHKLRAVCVTIPPCNNPRFCPCFPKPCDKPCNKRGTFSICAMFIGFFSRGSFDF